MPDVLSRREVLVGAAALAIATRSPALAQTSAGTAGKPDTLHVGKAVFSSFPFAALDVGMDAGIWKSLNLDIQNADFKGDAQVQQGFTAGSVDIGLGSGPSMAYRSKGVPAIAVAVMAGRPLDMALVVAKGSPIKSLAALKGQRVGVTTAGSLTDWLARQISTDQGWGPDGVNVIAMGAMETRISALDSGQIQASVHDLTEAYEIERVGKGTILTLFGDIVKDFDTHVIFAHDNLIAQRPQVLQRFLKGWFTTVAYMRKNRDATIKTVARVLQVDESVVAKSYPADMAMMSNDGAFSQAALDEVRKSDADLGLYDGTLDPKNMYTTRFVPVKV
jgi:ABC-type nitrate/sulfonate/bicarbonate transport system substrate-binding protein